MEISQKVKNSTAVWSGNSTSGYISRGNATLSRRVIYTLKLIATLFTIGKTEKQPKGSLADGWIKTHTHMHRNIIQSQKEILLFTTTWMDLVGIMLSEVSQKKRQIPYYVLYKLNLKTSNSGLPWWLHGKESTCQWRRRGFDPRSGKIPHAEDELSPCATTIDSVL